MLLLLNSVSHLLVDGVCAATVFGPLGGDPALTEWILLYNTLAFSTQCLVGLAADRLRRHPLSASLAMLGVALGYALPLAAPARIVLIGLGNSVFHVAGGAMTLERSEGRAGVLGVFVAPGAVGLALGTLWPGLGAALAALLVLCALAIVPAAARAPEGKTLRRTPASSEHPVLVPVLLALAVAVRAVGGTAVRFPWKSGALLSLLTVFFVYAGKSAGGFLCDRIGPRRAALASIVPAAVLIAFCSGWMVPSLLGQLALNLTMPVTLWLLYRALPEEPGFAFGLAASALWPGTIVGKWLTLTGPALWLFVLVSFLFGLGAVLFSVRSLSLSEDLAGGAS